jgi:phosphoribosylanthranilate isomerase
MTWVKICGMTNLEDALTAVEAGADAVGFVFYEKSPRRVSVEAAREIVGKLPESVEKIGVFVNGGEQDPARVLLEAGLSGMQSYFSLETAAGGKVGTRRILEASLLPKRARFMIALPMRLFGEDVEQIQMSADSAEWGQNRPDSCSHPEDLYGTFVLDSGDLRSPGGTGKAFDWEKAVPIAEAMRRGGVNLVVAGGLTPANVGDAMGILKPWGVDVASGVEARPGKKDPEKVRAFVKAVRDADGLHRSGG